MGSKAEGVPVISVTAKCDRLSSRDLQPSNEGALMSRGSENKNGVVRFAFTWHSLAQRGGNKSFGRNTFGKSAFDET
jgi:hypothetical protein